LKKEIKQKIKKERKKSGLEQRNSKETKISKHLSRVRGLPLKKRKLIFWLIMLGVSFILITLFILITVKRISNWRSQDFQQEIDLPSFDFKNLKEQ